MFNNFLNSSKLWEKLQKKSIVATEATMTTPLAAAILAGNNRRDDWGPMAAMMGGGMNNWMNNPFAYLMFTALLRNGGFGFGGDGAGAATQGIETLNNHWKDEQALKIQDLKFELSQERQNNLINERFNRLGNCGCGWNNSCGCGNGCGC